METQETCPWLYNKNHCLICDELWDCQNFKSSDLVNTQKEWVLLSILRWVKTKVWKLVILLWVWTITLDEITDYLVYKDLNNFPLNIEQSHDYLKEKEKLDQIEDFVHIILKIIISIFTLFILYLTWKKDEEIDLSNEKSKNLELIISRLIEVLKTLKEKEALLNWALGKLELSNTAKWAFMANLAHELRSPLNVISWYAEMFSLWLVWDMNEKMARGVHTILVASKHLSTLIDDILESSKIESWNTTLNKENWDISKSLRDVLQILVIEFDVKNIQLDLLIDENVIINYDEIKIKQVLINIIRNALKFTNHNWIVKISLTEEEWIVTIVVSDNWMWIKSEDLDKICTPFVQWENSVKWNIKWTWLWLAISKWIIEAHSWTFKIESEWEWKWTIVTITLPKN